MSSSRISSLRHSSLRPVRRLRRKLMCNIVQGLLDARHVVEGNARFPAGTASRPGTWPRCPRRRSAARRQRPWPWYFSAGRIPVNGNYKLFHNERHWTAIGPARLRNPVAYAPRLPRQPPRHRGKKSGYRRAFSLIQLLIHQIKRVEKKSACSCPRPCVPSGPAAHSPPGRCAPGTGPASSPAP